MHSMKWNQGKKTRGAILGGLFKVFHNQDHHQQDISVNGWREFRKDKALLLIEYTTRKCT